jgi:hypothetical protein
MRNLRTLVFASFVLATTAMVACADDLKLQAKLIWGSNDKPEDIKRKTVNRDLAESLQRTFKWKNYFEITNEIGLIPLGKSYEFKMSDRCTLKVKNLGDSRVEVNCIGEGKQVSKGTHTLPPTWLVIGGNDTNNTAWFVGLRAVDSSLTAAKKP